jgi:hypothetical protein
MTESDFARSYFHPEHQKLITLGESLGMYAWHCNHHTAQVEIVIRDQPS